MSLLPLVTLVCLTLFIHGKSAGGDWRQSVLHASSLWGAYTVLSTEILSLFNALTQVALALVWIFALLLAILGLYSVRNHISLRLPSLDIRRGVQRWILWASLGLIVLLTLIVAVKSPPQTWDSLNYHMSRVAHWAQAHALQHYATGIEVQNNMPPGAEIFVAHTYILSQSDHWVNLVQWLAMLGCLIGGSALAGKLGARRNGQLLCALFIATLPMGISEATSTMTDYVLAFWLLCVAGETLLVLQGRVDQAGVAYLGLATGLAVLTKPTGYAYLLPFAVLILWSMVRSLPRSRVVIFGLVVLILFGALNAGQFLRNQETYGGPLGPPDRYEQHGNQLLSLRGLISNLLRNLSLHLQTPSPYLNKALALGVQGVHDLIGLDINDPRTTAAGRFKVSTPTTNEILIGNPVHMMIILLSLLVLIRRRVQLDSTLKIYAVTVLSTTLVFSFVFKWLIFGSRLHLPFFVLFAPVAAALVKPAVLEIWSGVIGAALLTLAVPWLIGIETRPLIPVSPNSPVESVLSEDRWNLLFANGLYLLEPTRDVVLRIEESQCTQIGVLFSGNGVEYPLWSFLDAPDANLRIEWIVKGTYSDRYSADEFSPCAIVCENCTFQGDTLQGLKAAFERAPYRLYLKADELE